LSFSPRMGDMLTWSTPPRQISHTIGATIRLWDPQKVRILLNFGIEMPLRNFTKFAEVVHRFRMERALAVRSWMDLLKGLLNCGGFKLRGAGFPGMVQCPLPHRRNYASDPQKFCRCSKM